jgi:hypothetical protein
MVVLTWTSLRDWNSMQGGRHSITSGRGADSTMLIVPSPTWINSFRSVWHSRLRTVLARVLKHRKLTQHPTERNDTVVGVIQVEVSEERFTTSMALEVLSSFMRMRHILLMLRTTSSQWTT